MTPCIVKKTLQLLVAQGNNYVVTVTGNQGTLKAAFEQLPVTETPLDQTIQLDNTHSRWVERFTRVYAVPQAIADVWPAAARMIVIERYGIREGEPLRRTSYYLTSLTVDAKRAAKIVQQHRDIENGWHWVRDVVFKEDASRLTQRLPALNWSVLISVALNS